MQPRTRTAAAAILAVFCAPLAYAQTSASTATIHIDAAHVENQVSPRMYAAFAEMMAEDVKRGLTAEMLLDRSFEQAPDYLGLPAHWQLEPDERNDNVGAIKFVQTAEEAYPRVDAATGAANHALAIKLAPDSITEERRGLSQGKLSVRAGQTYKGYFWAKTGASDGYTGHIRVALEQDVTDGQTYAETAISAAVTGEWRQYAFTLTPSATDRFAKLTLLFDGKGTLFLDQLSLELADSRTEVRPDSEAMIGMLQPSFLRWPGGNVAQDYHWRWGIGPRDLRPVWINQSWSNAPEPDDFGTDEYLALCERLHIEPSITVNVGGANATAAEAASWVEYVNGPATSKYGAMRAANGHPAPYGVHQWELGNEIFGDWVRGHVTAEQYAQQAVLYAQAMRAVDPSIQLIAVGQGVAPQSDAWNTAVLKIAGPAIQFLAIHDYTSAAQNAKTANPRNTMMGRAGEFEANYRHLAALIHQNAPGRPIRLIVNEWNLFDSAGVIQSMDGAVYAARMMNGFERDGDIVEANSISDLLNGWIGGILQASRDRIYATPQFYAVAMYRKRFGTARLHAEVAGPELQPGTRALDAVATRSADGSSVFLKLSNADAAHALSTTIDLANFAHRDAVSVDLLAAADRRQRNTFEEPQQVAPTTQALQCKRTCVFQLPADSVAVLTFVK